MEAGPHRRRAWIPPDRLATLLSSPRPIVVAVVETVGILAIVWLMVLKPF